MWKYVSRRVKDTIDLGINVRKSFTVQNALNNHPQQQQHPNERKQNHNNFYNVVPRHQDPSSRDKERQRDEKFKKKYYRLHQDKKCFLSALTWVSYFTLKLIFVPQSRFFFLKTVYGSHHRILCFKVALLVSAQPAFRV